MSKRMSNVWTAPPHTRAKLAILKAYLDAWLPILGRSRRGEPLLYIDGFAGPGEYDGSEPGSPVLALDCGARALENAAYNWIAGELKMVFCEADEFRAANLESVLSRKILPSGITKSILHGDFVDCFTHLRASMPGFFETRHPLFAFIDPFGPKGVPFDVVCQILKSPTSEVLLNFDADGIMRIYGAGKQANHREILSEVFGSDEWERTFAEATRFEEQCRIAADLYMRKLRQDAGTRYVFRFEMRGKSDALNYYLIFAGNNPLGLEKMKEAMRTVDQDGSYRFSDGRVGQTVLFRFDEPRMHAMDMHKAFSGQNVSWEEIRDYTLNESPFEKPKRMLEVLEEEEMIEVTAKCEGRKRRQFTEETIISVKFVQPPPRLF